MFCLADAGSRIRSHGLQFDGIPITNPGDGQTQAPCAPAPSAVWTTRAPTWWGTR